ncbi:DUF3291 domain-containing protein [Roseobacter sp. A03A-229]
MPGFVWMMEARARRAWAIPRTRSGADPRFVPNLSVWESVAQMETFVWARSTNSSTTARGMVQVLGEMHFVIGVPEATSRPWTRRWSGSRT